MLARRSWRVPASLYPLPAAGEAPPEYFLRVHRWRIALGIPEQTYVRIVPSPKPTERAKPTAVDEVAPLIGRGNGVSSPKESLTTQSAFTSEAEQGDQSAPKPRTYGAHDEQSAPATRAILPQRASRDWHKPQFIDFSSPLLVGLFARLSGNLRSFVAIVEERYPTADYLIESQGEAYTTEVILQLDEDPGVADAQPTPELR